MTQHNSGLTVLLIT